ncbi:hypothetical protein SCHPADRAFT_598464 [Schizopora paradoxa]|uniref:Uncharacterized protein n=1 Tax=Schizopora paradoxa TaxID=27342 RepID=A0A0H2RA71_9AGAM|nr:hypothetical protein SCHPADRAFT_598464 [Schizopora paradoxa]
MLCWRVQGIARLGDDAIKLAASSRRLLSAGLWPRLALRIESFSMCNVKPSTRSKNDKNARSTPHVESSRSIPSTLGEDCGDNYKTAMESLQSTQLTASLRYIPSTLLSPSPCALRGSRNSSASFAGDDGHQLLIYTDNTVIADCGFGGTSRTAVNIAMTWIPRSPARDTHRRRLHAGGPATTTFRTGGGGSGGRWQWFRR